MNQANITKRIQKALGGTATPGAAEHALEAVTNACIDALVEDGKLRLAGFGTFQLCDRAPRQLRLPSTGEPAQLPQRQVITFKDSPSTRLPGKLPDPPATHS